MFHHPEAWEATEETEVGEVVVEEEVAVYSEHLQGISR